MLIGKSGGWHIIGHAASDIRRSWASLDYSKGKELVNPFPLHGPLSMDWDWDVEKVDLTPTPM